MAKQRFSKGKVLAYLQHHRDRAYNSWKGAEETKNAPKVAEFYRGNVVALNNAVDDIKRGTIGLEI